MTRRLSSPTLVGRASELASLLAAGEAASTGRPSLILVGGEAGVGKSRLTAEAATRLGADGWLTLSGGAVPIGADGLPFGPIVECLRNLAQTVDRETIAEAAGPELASLARLVPELSDDRVDASASSGSQPQWQQTRLFEGVLRLFGRLAQAQPVLVLIDDLHWADSLTRDLLAFLARAMRSERLLVVATYRTDELHRRHPLRAWLAEVERLPRVERLELHRLERSELQELLTAILGTAPSPRLLESIAARSEGNAFFAEELLAAGDGHSGRNGGEDLPDTLREVLLVRLAGVSDEAVRLAEVASVAGREVSHDMLVEVFDAPESALADPLRELVAAQLFVPSTRTAVETYRFRHTLVSEAIYGDLLPSERRQLHTAYARAGESRIPRGSTPATASDLVEVAHHWFVANDAPRALAAAIRAGDAARATYAFAEAAQQYARAVDLWPRVADADLPAPADLGDVLEAAGATAALVGESSRALELVRRAVAFADGLPSDSSTLDRRARARATLAAVAQQAGETATSVTALEEASRLLEGSPSSELRTRILERLAANLMIAGRFGESEPHAQRAIQEARAIGDRPLEANALATLGPDLTYLGDIEGGIEALRAATAIARDLDDPWVVLRAYGNLGSSFEAGGLLEEAFEVSYDGAALLGTRGAEQTLFAAALEANAASVLNHLGRFEESAALLEPMQAAALPGFVTLNLHVTSADLALRMGDLDVARANLELAWAEAGAIADAHFTIDLHATAAEAATWSGEPGRGLELAASAFERLTDKDDALLLGQLAIVGMRAAAEVAVTAAAGRRTAAAQGALEAADSVLGHYRASLDRLVARGPLATREIAWRLALCDAERARAAGDDQPEAWAAVRAGIVAARPWLAAYLLWREAEARARVERSAQATETLREAHRVATGIGAGLLVGEIEGLARRLRIELPIAQPAPRERDALGDAATAAEPDGDEFGLTAREREVLALVARGYTNRRIAEHLFISESTAGVHVSNILGKLGAESRTAAATIAVRLGLDDG